jgi:hypothetical protein
MMDKMSKFPEQIGTVVGAAILLATYSILIWTVVRNFL